MSYDGPSFYKKNHPRVKPIRRKPKPKKKEKVSWADKANHYENEHKNKLPDSIRTRGDLRNEAVDYMEMPADQNIPANDMPFKRKKTINRKIDEEKRRIERNRFRSKSIPPSLQHLEGWAKRTTNPELVAELRERLAKDKDSYILFAKDVEEPAPTADEKPVEKPVEKPKEKSKNFAEASNTFSENEQKKAERVKEEINSPLQKPGSGLHRSLSKIMAEDQEALANGRNNLSSLFSDD